MIHRDSISSNPVYQIRRKIISVFFTGELTYEIKIQKKRAYFIGLAITWMKYHSLRWRETSFN